MTPARLRSAPATGARFPARALPAPRPLSLLLGLLISTSPAAAAAQSPASQSPHDPTATASLKPYDPRAITRHASAGTASGQEVFHLPYSLFVLPGSVLLNQQMTSIHTSVRQLPWVQADTPRPQTRGIQGGTVQNTLADGFHIVAATQYPVEAFERTEILNGIGTALYGPAPAAGHFNLVQKRAARSGSNTLMLGINESGALAAHADLWTPLSQDARWRLRTNLLNDSGDAYAAGSHLRRSLASVALDADLSPDTQWQTNLSHYRFIGRGLPARFGTAAGVPFPAALDPKREGYGQVFAGLDSEDTLLSTRLTHRLANGWTLDAGLAHQTVDRRNTSALNMLIDGQGNYRSMVMPLRANRQTVYSQQLGLQGRLQTGDIRHDLALVSRGFDSSTYDPAQSTGAPIVLGNANLDAPRRYAEPVWPDFEQHRRATRQRQQSLLLTDTLRLNERWTLTLNAGHHWIGQQNFGTEGQTLRRSSDTGFSHLVALSHFVSARTHLYLSHADSLQPGDQAPQGTANAGQVLDAVRSQQWELGLKSRLPLMDVTAAFFHIERPFGYADAAAPIDGLPTFRLAGRQISQGFEASTTGTLARILLLSAGLTWLDTRLADAPDPRFENRQIVGTNRWSASLSANLIVPTVRGLSLNARVIALGRSPTNYANTDWLSGYAIINAGIRYQHRLAGSDTIWRLTINNLMDKQYWSGAITSETQGYNGIGNANASIGAPRMVRLSMQMDF